MSNDVITCNVYYCILLYILSLYPSDEIVDEEEDFLENLSGEEGNDN